MKTVTTAYAVAVNDNLLCNKVKQIHTDIFTSPCVMLKYYATIFISKTNT